MIRLKDAKKVFGELASPAAQLLIAATADVALRLTDGGMVTDVAFGRDDLAALIGDAWIGRRWIDTVTRECRVKVEALLQEASETAPSRWRGINHPVPLDSAELPMEYRAIRLGSERRILVVGRDLRRVAHMQQRLLDATQVSARDDALRRLADKRYRLLLRTSAQPLLVVRADNLQAIDVNAAAVALLHAPADRLRKHSLLSAFDEPSARNLRQIFADAETDGAAQCAALTLAGAGAQVNVSVLSFRQANLPCLFVHLTAHEDRADSVSPPPLRSKLLEVVAQTLDAIVVTDADGRVQYANRAFQDLIQARDEQQIQGTSLGDWLGPHGPNLDALLSTLRERRAMRALRTTLRGRDGEVSPVDVSAVAVVGGETPCFGFSIRPITLSVHEASTLDAPFPRTAPTLTERVGQVPLQELVRESSEAIERLCIEKALQLASDNPVQAAQMLGLSHQALQAKLSRHGLGNACHQADDTEPTA